MDKAGDLFTEGFLYGKPEETLTPELMGHWLGELSEMVDGERLDWKALPGIEQWSWEAGTLSEVKSFGLPHVGPRDEDEWNQARVLNTQYLFLRAEGRQDEANTVRDNPLWKKYFGSVPSSIFWDTYYEMVPPGGFSKSLRNHPAMQMILDKPVRYAMGTSKDYLRALKVMETWVDTYAEQMEELGFGPKDFQRVRDLTKQYFSIPQEMRDARKAFLDENPILKRYWDAEAAPVDKTIEYPDDEESDGTTEKPATQVDKKREYRRRGRYSPYSGGGRSGGGGGGSSGVSVSDAKAIWNDFTRELGGSQGVVVRFLRQYWKGEALTKAQKRYLEKLYAKAETEMEFEEWLEVLKKGYVAANRRQWQNPTWRLPRGGGPETPRRIW
jgi:hypothetical protein